MAKDDDKKLTTRQARQALVFGSDDEREGVKQELATIAASDIADVMSWDEQGRVSLRETADIPASCAEGHQEGEGHAHADGQRD